MERPLVGAEDGDDDHGSDHPASRTSAALSTQPPPPDAAAAAAAAVPPSAGRGPTPSISLPSQSEELQVVSALATDASEILWEMLAMGETGAAMDEMRSRAEMLQSQLRGLIADYSLSPAGVDEMILAGSLSAFDMLNSCLDDQTTTTTTAAAAPVAVGVEEVTETVGSEVKEQPSEEALPPVAAVDAVSPPQPRVLAPPPTAAPITTTTTTATAAAAAPTGADLISFE